MLMPNGKVETYSNVHWINNVPPKPTPMELTPKGIDEVGKTKLPDNRLKRRLTAIHENFDLDLGPTLAPGEENSKKRCEASVEPPVSFLKCVYVPAPAPKAAAALGESSAPVPSVASSSAALGELTESESPDTLSNDTLIETSSATPVLT